MSTKDAGNGQTVWPHRIGKTIFTDRYANSLPHLLRAIENVRRRDHTKKKELGNEQMRIVLRICMHAYCIINKRVLQQTPTAGKKPSYF